ncbi:MAG TPA: response regulator [Nitrosopumilaceae archaeon]|nr:response regulator [Nitrosopumilaceae archaeon]
MAEKDIKQKYELALTYLKNKQSISAYNLFLELAEKESKNASFRAGLFFMLAAECKVQQGKDGYGEFLKAGRFYMRLAKKEKPYNARQAYLCAAKCFLRVSQYEEARKAFEMSKKYIAKVEGKRPIVVVDDSPAVIMKIEGYLKKLGYKNIHTFNTGSDAVRACKKLIDSSQNPIVLLDMGLPDIEGDIVASHLLDSKLDLSIILITADEKTTPRVQSTISLGTTAFIQKPFDIDDLKRALDIAESD